MVTAWSVMMAVTTRFNQFPSTWKAHKNIFYKKEDYY